MHKKIILLGIALFLSIKLAYSETIIKCPSVSEIKSGQFNHWLPLYIDGEELASDKDVALFARNVDSFANAKWSASYLESAHCFYHGNHTLNQKIIFAQDAWQPSSSNKWQWLVPKKLAECDSQNINDCLFIT